MAKHFKQDTQESTAVMSARQMRKAQNSRIQTEATASHLPYGQAASYRASYSDAAPTDEYFLEDMPVRGGLPAVGRVLLLLLAWAVRLCAIAAFFLVMANAFMLPVFRTQLTSVTDLVTSYLPWRSTGLLAVDTPLGGTFRGDLAIVSLLLFLIDWLLCRLRVRLR